MLRWLATLSYQTIASRSSEFLTNTDLVGKGQDDDPEPALQPKHAIFSVRFEIYNLFNLMTSMLPLIKYNFITMLSTLLF